MAGKHAAAEEQLALQAVPAASAGARALVLHKSLAVSSPSQSLQSEVAIMKRLGEDAAGRILQQQEDYYFHIQKAKDYLGKDYDHGVWSGSYNSSPGVSS